MKSEVYSWRISAHLKTELESEARREDTSLAVLLERIASNWLQVRRKRRPDEDEQAAIRRRAASAIGSLSVADPMLSSQVSQRMKESLKKRHDRSRAR